MRQSAIEFSRLVDEAWDKGQRWDAIFCTDMLNVAEFKGLLKTEAAKIPVLLYFHENQFVYPNRVTDPRDFHFSFTNFTSALAANCVWFNSEFNRDSMLDEISDLSQKWPDYSPSEAIELVRGKSQVQPPGVDLRELPDPNFEANDEANEPLHVVWASRWEHDKNPDRLLEILRDLRSRNFEFALSVLGESYSNIPDAFPAIQSEFAEHIVNWGFQETRQDYFAALSAGDVFLSTADHEFFGIAAVEAMAAGLVPILPNGLAYPEVLASLSMDSTSDCLYNSVADAALKIVNASSRSLQQRRQSSAAVRARYCADRRAHEMDQAVCKLIETQCKSF